MLFKGPPLVQFVAISLFLAALALTRWLNSYGVRRGKWAPMSARLTLIVAFLIMVGAIPFLALLQAGATGAYQAVYGQPAGSTMSPKIPKPGDCVRYDFNTKRTLVVPCGS